MFGMWIRAISRVNRCSRIEGGLWPNRDHFHAWFRDFSCFVFIETGFEPCTYKNLAIWTDHIVLAIYSSRVRSRFFFLISLFLHLIYLSGNVNSLQFVGVKISDAITPNCNDNRLVLKILVSFLYRGVSRICCTRIEYKWISHYHCSKRNITIFRLNSLLSFFNNIFWRQNLP